MNILSQLEKEERNEMNVNEIFKNRNESFKKYLSFLNQLKKSIQ